MHRQKQNIRNLLALNNSSISSPLKFHNVHGENIRIVRNSTVARRSKQFSQGIVFSSRPVDVNEKVGVKFEEMSNNSKSVIRFGFTNHDPSTLQTPHALPNYACPGLTNKSGYWAKALDERYCTQDTILFYYVTSSGDVHFLINGEDKGIFLSGVETKSPLWALIDVVYGNSTAIKFLEAQITTVDQVDLNSQVNWEIFLDGLGGHGDDCLICCKNSIDTILVSCLHSCMCFKCAVEQWVGKGNGHCPLCRAIIKRVTMHSR